MDVVISSSARCLMGISCSSALNASLATVRNPPEIAFAAFFCMESRSLICRLYRPLEPCWFGAIQAEQAYSAIGAMHAEYICRSSRVDRPQVLPAVAEIAWSRLVVAVPMCAR